MGKRDEASLFPKDLNIAKGNHISLERGATNGKEPIPQIPLLLLLLIPLNTLLHTFGNTILNDRFPQANFLIINETSNRILANFIL